MRRLISIGVLFVTLDLCKRASINVTDFYSWVFFLRKFLPAEAALLCKLGVVISGSSVSVFISNGASLISGSASWSISGQMYKILQVGRISSRDRYF